jgi:hypothetical protein
MLSIFEQLYYLDEDTSADFAKAPIGGASSDGVPSSLKKKMPPGVEMGRFNPPQKAILGSFGKTKFD